MTPHARPHDPTCRLCKTCAFLAGLCLGLLLILTADWAWAVPITELETTEGRSGITPRTGLTPRTGITARSTHCAHFDPGVCGAASESVVLPPAGAMAGLLGAPVAALHPTPEPATLLLLGGTLAGLGWWTRRRK